MKKIIHIDMDAFFASIEQRDRGLYGRAVIVGGRPEHRGVVSTCSYEARKFGVHSAMPTRTALRFCPGAVLLPPDFKKYSRISSGIMDMFRRCTDLVEELSIDEAYLDVSSNRFGLDDGAAVAARLQSEIREATGLTASAGVSYNKFLAKVASDIKKPAGLTVITPEQAVEFLSRLPIEKFYGIGAVAAAKLRSINIRCGEDLRKLDLALLTAMFGKAGVFYHNIVRGIDERPVEPRGERKSVGREITLVEDCSELLKLHIFLRSLAFKVGRKLLYCDLAGRTVTVKVRYEDFSTVTRSHSLSRPTCDGAQIGEIAIMLSRRTELGRRPVRLIGVTVSNFARAEEFEQLELPF